MSKFNGLSVVIVMVLALTSLVSAEVIYQNDFGTVAQRTVGVGGEWDSESFDWGPDNPDLVYYDNGWNNISADLDGDGLHGGLSANGWESRIWVKEISAPGDMVMSNITLTAHGHGHPSHGAGFAVGLSLDGVTWNYTDYVSAAGLAYPDNTASVSPGFAPDFDGVETVYIRINWSDGNHTFDQPWYSAYITDVTLIADLVTAPPPTLPSTLQYVNDFGTVAQRTVGGAGDWDSSITLHGTPNLQYYADGFNGISEDLDGDTLHGGLSASGQMGVRYVKQFTASDDYYSIENISMLVKGHADPCSNASFGIGVSLDGNTWDRVYSMSEPMLIYPDNYIYVAPITDPNYLGITSFYMMVEWNNQDNTTDPCLAAYITDVQVAYDEVGTPVLDATDWSSYGMGPDLDCDFRFSDLPISPGGWAYDWFDPTNPSNPGTAQGYWDGIRATRRAGRPWLVILGLGSGTIAEKKVLLDNYFDMDNVVAYRSDLLGVALSHEQDGTKDAEENELYDYIKANWPEVQVYKFYSFPLMPYSLWTSGIAEKCDGYLYDDYYNTDPTVFRRRVMRFLVTGKPLIMVIWGSEPNWNGQGWFIADWLDGVPEDDQNYMVTAAPNSTLEQYYWMASDTLREFGLPVGQFSVTRAGSVYGFWGIPESPNHEYLRDEMTISLRFDMRISDGQPQPTSDYADGDSHAINTGGAYSYTDAFTTDGIYAGLGTINEASIIGFSNLLQLPVSSGALATCDEGPGQVELIYRFYAPSGSLGSVSATLSGSVEAGQGGVNTIALSLNGRNITDSSSTTVTGGSEYANCEAFYVHIIMSYNSSPEGSPANTITNLSVSATHNAAGTPVPEPNKCGDLGFMASDIAGPDGLIPDCIVDVYDFAAMAAQWNDCTDPASEDCQ